MLTTTAWAQQPPLHFFAHSLKYRTVSIPSLSYQRAATNMCSIHVQHRLLCCSLESPQMDIGYSADYNLARPRQIHSYGHLRATLANNGPFRPEVCTVPEVSISLVLHNNFKSCNLSVGRRRQSTSAAAVKSAESVIREMLRGA